jgi:glucokinase
MLLAGDIGGTKTHLAVFSLDAGAYTPLAESTFRSANYVSLEAVVREFLSSIDLNIDRACFGVAGPVVHGRAVVTNLPWEMEETGLADALGLEGVTLLNDLESIANAVPLLQAGDVQTLNDRPPESGGAIAIIAPGTGLGEAFLIWNGKRYEAHPSEGGHADFGPTTELQIDLLRYLQDIYGHVSYERVCSGIGIPNIYAFLKAHGHAEEPVWLADKLAAAPDATPVIVDSALGKARPCALCAATLDTFVSILGAESGNLALKTLATGGVYLGGGIPPRILPALNSGAFMQSFQDKGRFNEFMIRLPVHVILNANAALLGAARFGLETQTSQATEGTP